ncbi:ferredoxin--NADP reductase [Noviherbaspirillum sp. ST9]|uniref:ferredoxin--NADP reductase n=1 Tax=Noviherbaspirillum sp. ST9 TaxID=3401606 RepID=UPI003B58AC47
MNAFDTRLISREVVAEGTLAFHFKKPDGFSFKPGQAIDLVLRLPESEGEVARHAFSLVSAPHEDDLVVATRMRDSLYKKTLASLAQGDAVRIEGPFGSLLLHSDRARPAVFIAGGIGITPFMSMLRQAAFENQSRDLSLLYSNRRPEDAAFLDELQELATRNRGIKVIATMTDITRSKRRWDGPTGAINEGLVASVVTRDVNPVYYLVGPPGLVEALRDMLSRVGIGDDDIRSEEFYGY